MLGGALTLTRAVFFGFSLLIHTSSETFVAKAVLQDGRRALAAFLFANIARPLVPPSARPFMHNARSSTWHQPRAHPTQATEDGVGSDDVEDYRKMLMLNFDDNEEGTKEDADNEIIARSDSIGPGQILLANPNHFVEKLCKTSCVRDLERFGLKSLLANEWGNSPDALVKRLPVILVLQHGDSFPAPSRGVMLERRSSILMGDLPPEVGDFGCVAISTLFAGGMQDRSVNVVHNVEGLQSAEAVGNGLFMGGWEDARPRIENQSLAEGRFKFFHGNIIWLPGQLQKEIDDGAWITIKCDPSFVLKDRTSGWDVRTRIKPLWTEALEKLGDDEARQILSLVYKDDQ